LTSFGADANNNGFSPAPSTTVNISAKTLMTSIPASSDFYLAWNYSVSSTTTTTNAQALAIDNISIKGSPAGGGGSTNPTGVGAANPSSVLTNGSTLLTVTVTPGTNPVSTGLTVAANLVSIGGSPTQQFFDDGSNGDLTAGDNIFSYTATVAGNTTGGAKTLPFTITDAEFRSGSGNISLTVLAPTNPTASGSANPSSTPPGGSTILTANVTPGTNPTSTGITVTGDLTSIGGVANQAFVGNGNSFTYQAIVALGTPGGAKSLPILVTDAQGRTATTNIALSIDQPAD